MVRTIPSMEWKDRGDRHRGEAKNARDRLQRARRAGGYSNGGPDAKRAIDEAIAVVNAENERMHRAVGPEPAELVPGYKLQSRIVPESYIAVHAKVLLGIEAELAMALEHLAVMREREAERMAAERELAEAALVG